MTQSRSSRVVARLASARTRALLSLGIVLGLTSVSTLAYWTDEAQLTTGTIQSGELDLLLDGQDQLPSTSKLAIEDLIPGESVAATITVHRAANTIAFTYGATGSVVSQNELTAALRFKVFAGSAQSVVVTGSGLRTQACSGDQLAGGAAGMTWTSTPASLFADRAALATPQQVQATDLTESLCLQAILPADASSDAQGRSAAASLAFTATQLS